MSELANYSIETDHTVLLAFKDGRKLRVPTGQLSHYLTKPDLEKIRAAMRLRRDFISRHMPKVALLVAATGLIGLLTVGGRAVAQLISPPKPAPAPDNTEVVRNQLYPAPASASPVPTPAVKGTSVASASANQGAKQHPKATPKPRLVPQVSPVAGANLPIPTPFVSPNPIAGSDQPSPTPLPTPQIPNQDGQVLGDSVTPPGTPADPGPLSNTTPSIP